MKKVLLFISALFVCLVCNAQIPAPHQTDTLLVTSVKYNFADINAENWPFSVIYKSTESFTMGKKQFKIVRAREGSDGITFYVEDMSDSQRYELLFKEGYHRKGVTILFSGYEFCCQYETRQQNKESGPSPMRIVEEKPSFKGGDANQFSVWVNKHLNYPKDAKQNGIQGRVTLQFTVDVDGRVKDVNVLKGVFPSLDAEAVRVISSSPKWKPGKSGGEPVDVTYTFPVYFQCR